MQSCRYRDYAYIQLLKMCHFLQKVRNIEILKMHAQFLKDDNHNVWFSYAYDIHYRGRNDRDAGCDTGDKVNPLQLAESMRNQRDILHREIADERRQENIKTQKEHYVTQKIEDFMNVGEYG